MPEGAVPENTVPENTVPEDTVPDPPAAGSSQPPEPGRRRWRLLLGYDGSAFRGFAAQPGVVTVAGALAETLARTLQLSDPPRLVAAGRTDAGVHARGQVVHADLPEPLPDGRAGRPRTGDELRQSLNRQLGPSVVVQRLEPAPAGFDARRSARSRHYRYLIWNAPQPDPLLAPLTWHREEPLDLRRMQAGADALLGQHDFRSFCRRAPGTSPDEPIVRRVLEARWSVEDGAETEDAAAAGSGRLLRFEIAASSFCHQMVRSIVGLLVEAGAGRQTTASVVEALRATTRAGTPGPAPAHALCLTAVTYEGPQAW